MKESTTDLELLVCFPSLDFYRIFLVKSFDGYLPLMAGDRVFFSREIEGDFFPNDSPVVKNRLFDAKGNRLRIFLHDYEEGDACSYTREEIDEQFKNEGWYVLKY